MSAAMCRRCKLRRRRSQTSRVHCSGNSALVPCSCQTSLQMTDTAPAYTRCQTALKHIQPRTDTIATRTVHLDTTLRLHLRPHIRSTAMPARTRYSCRASTTTSTCPAAQLRPQQGHTPHRPHSRLHHTQSSGNESGLRAVIRGSQRAALTSWPSVSSAAERCRAYSSCMKAQAGSGTAYTCPAH